MLSYSIIKLMRVINAVIYLYRAFLYIKRPKFQFHCTVRLDFGGRDLMNPIVHLMWFDNLNAFIVLYCTYPQHIARAINNFVGFRIMLNDTRFCWIVDRQVRLPNLIRVNRWAVLRSQLIKRAVKHVPHLLQHVARSFRKTNCPKKAYYPTKSS